MSEIFISYSLQNQAVIEEICSYLEEAGCPCWVSYRRSDLKPGALYTQAIAEAIAKSKIFIVALSLDSVSSIQVHNELALANGYQKDGLVILPVLIDDALQPYRLNPAVDYVIAGKQALYWSRESDKKSLLHMCQSVLSTSTQDERYKYYLRRRTTAEKILISHNGFSIGRKKELCDYWMEDNLAVSRKHAILYLKDGKCFITDNESGNKVYINDVEIPVGKKVLLKHQDIIDLGGELFIVERERV